MISWDEGAGITPAERAAIAKSVQTFQLGESGEGRHLLRVSAEHAIRAADLDYLQAVKLFIKEEQRHARDLGAFLDAAGIPRLKQEWTDQIFRRLRHLAGLELTISVLLTAELLANVYYAVLRDATCSESLRQLCGQILKDEVAHVRFQSERLALLRHQRLCWTRFAPVLFQGLYWTTAAVLWWTHRPVFRSARLSVRGFCRKAQKELSGVLNLMDPTQYAFARERLGQPFISELVAAPGAPQTKFPE